MTEKTNNNVIDLNEYKKKHRISFASQKDFDITVDKLMKMGRELFKDDTNTHKPDTCSLLEQLIEKNKNKNNKKPNADDILDMIRDRNYFHVTIKNPRKNPNKD